MGISSEPTYVDSMVTLLGRRTAMRFVSGVTLMIEMEMWM